MVTKNLVLGVDIGTTSVKVCIVETVTGEIVSKQNKDTQSNVPSDQGTGGNKQDVPKIISALNTCIAKLPKDLLKQIQKVGICGQMHGVMLWNNKDGVQAWERIEKEGTLIRYDIFHERVSNLYTWQDSRCDSTFIASLPPSQSHLPTYSGYGVATLFWMVKNKPEKLKKYNCAGTIQDFVVAMLCNLKKPVMSVQNAASWGYFDCGDIKWNIEILKKAGFPVHLLPDVALPGSVAGNLTDNFHTIPKGTPIGNIILIMGGGWPNFFFTIAGVALGDLQCSVLATVEFPQDAVLNISTSAQLAFVAENYNPTKGPPKPQPVEYFPYFNGKYLAVAASLNGGNALATFVKMIQQWTMELGFNVPQCKHF